MKIALHLWSSENRAEEAWFFVTISGYIGDNSCTGIDVGGKFDRMEIYVLENYSSAALLVNIEGI
jgi:hypothetical protein